MKRHTFVAWFGIRYRWAVPTPTGWLAMIWRRFSGKGGVMHTVEEIIEQVWRLSLQDRRRLVEELKGLLARKQRRTSPLLTGRTLGLWHLLAPSMQTSQMCRSISISTWLRHTPIGMTISEARLRGQRGVFRTSRAE